MDKDGPCNYSIRAEADESTGNACKE